MANPLIPDLTVRFEDGGLVVPRYPPSASAASLPADLVVDDAALAELREFMEKYLPDVPFVPFEPKWYLSSYWG